jgi:acrylyl-CoA reductase (NADPH)
LVARCLARPGGCQSWGLSQTHHGGYAHRARLNGDCLVKLIESLSTKDAMAIGAAGHTVMLSVLAYQTCIGSIREKRCMWQICIFLSHAVT